MAYVAEKENVAAVCGKEVRIYDPVYKGVRALVSVIEFQHKGAAQLYAMEYDESIKRSAARRSN
jgi:hypothetical protein